MDVIEIGSFHVGGGEVSISGQPTREVVVSPGSPPMTVDPNGELEANQMYVQYVRLAQPRAKYPLLMWHGGGLTGVTWETKPDGQPGWQMFFLRAGHDVYVSDAVERGRASWSRYPDVFTSEPVFRVKKEAWELFRIGPDGSYAPNPADRVAYPGSRFPTAAFDQFAKQGVPRWMTNDAATQAAYDALVQRVGPCVLITHSQSGNFGFQAALNAPDKVAAVVTIEPAGSPDVSRVSVAPVAGVPHLWVFGDYVDDTPRWAAIRARQARYRQALLDAGGTADWIELPALGITGNSHMLMMDDNSDEIATIIQRWFVDHGLMR